MFPSGSAPQVPDLGGLAVCEVCGAALTRVADETADEWVWADAGGQRSGADPDLAHLYDPAANPLGAVNPSDALARMAALLDTGHKAVMAGKAGRTPLYWRVAREYSALKVWLDSGGTFHQHYALHGEPYQGDVPEHCGWPMRLTPSGWRCRQCSERRP